MANWQPWVGNGVHFTLLFFMWVACLVAFGGELHRLEGGGLNPLSYYQDRASGNGVSSKWSSLCNNNVLKECDECQAGGGGIVAMLFFAWFINMFHDVLAVARVLGRESRLPKLNLDQLKCLKIELGCAIAECILFFFGVIAWGPCYSGANDNKKSYGFTTISPAGYGFIVFCFFPVSLLQIAFIVWCRRAPDQWRIGAAPAGKTDNPAQPPAASAGQTSGPMDPAPQYVGPPQGQPQYPPPSQYPPQQQQYGGPPPAQYAEPTGQEGVPR